jgi:hypothetical protein
VSVAAVSERGGTVSKTGLQADAVCVFGETVFG